jgi:hypothetical protein
MVELCSGEFNVAYCRDPKWKLPTPPPGIQPQLQHTGSLTSDIKFSMYIQTKYDVCLHHS